jgi:hypothetical protein
MTKRSPTVRQLSFPTSFDFVVTPKKIFHCLLCAAFSTRAPIAAIPCFDCQFHDTKGGQGSKEGLTFTKDLLWLRIFDGSGANGLHNASSHTFIEFIEHVQSLEATSEGRTESSWPFTPDPRWHVVCAGAIRQVRLALAFLSHM